MCGIVGYIGERPAQSILLDCLRKLEYRGYDSCGVAVAVGDIAVYKDAVRVEALSKVAPRLAGVVGIGHTRWATHGEPSRANAHPHLDCTGNIAVVHNGVITNFRDLRRKLTGEGHSFTSETDTEVIPHLIEKYYDDSLEAAVEAALRDIEGSYAMVVLRTGESKLIVAKKDSPLVIGVGDRETFIASDAPAFLDYTDRVIYLEDGHIGVITKSNIKIKRDGQEVAKKEEKILWSAEEAQKAGYEYFMLKEIHEQPRVIRNTLAEYTRTTEATITEPILMLACGTSFHAALVGKYVFEELLHIPVRVELASEFNHQRNTLGRTLAIAITQSGETADTLKAMKRLKGEGGWVIAVTNVVGSTASRIAHQTIYTRAGPEISVAATKTFIAQLMALYWLAMSHSRVDVRRRADLLSELRQLPSKVQYVLDNEAIIAGHAKELSKYEHVFFIGRGINFPAALEGALKLKEVSYIHAEGYAAGETKHGPFALLGSETPVIAIVSRDNTYEAMLTSIKEIKARTSPVIAVTEGEDEAVEELSDFSITVPHVDPLFSPVVNSVALQLLAYYTAKERGCSIDFPRNLAKSVTVE
ncbi:MAG: glutamine--fructose-6-phosphate transaminase (isomerizing) [Dehalococcoidales bacterium]|jgi:glucosamine--fructose-6-phosphate aminotransferase (isomerizing)|nr:glutamine--fructose-6-phosphate transaminase (isomerizing) [Dehalococcoidales bacterium]MDP6737797.1 glutamine--fructose-6-phosphate transaminase (isomerizing) [Dehalococcoidales bacterium]|tara:strand:+ start:8423 stop:10180 length:1758 start_codon:yes stop_codon:yes gene_type:complete